MIKIYCHNCAREMRPSGLVDDEGLIWGHLLECEHDQGCNDPNPILAVSTLEVGTTVALIPL